ncbi:uncharacterized protein LOC110038404 [Phalaenopsis equestris]|uniref:uncharacterized protein LOC110038404 n=1 Tax=Phalaenopsis equestris TaxID=78828 RepID=UPI0009E28C0D|nr:uncharacterized protein LOC110038404 [Phalaenopsis equestris]
MGNLSALLPLLLLLVSSSRFLLQEARPLHSSAAKENMAVAVKKGGGGGRGGGFRGGSNGDSSSPYGKAIPMIAGGAVVPKTAGFSSHKYKHNSAHSGYSFSIAALLIISAFWVESLACLYRLSY